MMLSRIKLLLYPHFGVPYPQLKRGQQSLGTLVAVVRLFRYIDARDQPAIFKCKIKDPFR